MNDRQDFSDIGEKIKDAVQDAVATGDFGHINRIVNDTVGSAMDEVRRQVNQVHDRMNRPLGSAGREEAPDGDIADRETGRRYDTSRYRTRTPRYPRAPRYPQETQRREQNVSDTQVYRSAGQTGLRRIFNKNGKVAGILFTVFGSIGMGGFGLTALILLIILLATGRIPFLLVMLFGILTAGFAVMLGKGCGLRARLKRAERYLKLVKEDMYMKTEDLAARTGQSVRRVRREIRKMIQTGIFPEGHMDEKESIFVLNDETWDQYLAELKEFQEKQRLEESSRQTVKSQPWQEEPGQGEGLSAEQQIEREGHAYMDRLRELNVQIPGEVISNRLYQLDYLLQRIFLVLKEHPEKCPQMRKFMDYYLPTTVKLVESYADFDRAGVQGENIMTARAEIEKTMDTINQAFEKLLDDMYQDAAFEAAADAKVLKTVLAQDGFMKSEFDLKTQKEGGSKE